MHPIFERLKERKIVQWALAYLAGAWLVTQVLDTVAGPWGLSDGLLRSGQVALMLGLLVTLVLAWYDGEQGRQRVSGPELLIIGGILGVGAVAVSFVGVPSAPPFELDAHDLEGVAVLPFETLSGTGEDRAFAEGLHFSLINTLERTVGDMTRVMARQAVLPYRDPTITADSIGRALAVEHLLYGAAHRVGDEVRLSTTGSSRAS